MKCEPLSRTNHEQLPAAADAIAIVFSSSVTTFQENGVCDFAAASVIQSLLLLLLLLRPFVKALKQHDAASLQAIAVLRQRFAARVRHEDVFACGVAVRGDDDGGSMG